MFMYNLEIQSTNSKIGPKSPETEANEQPDHQADNKSHL